MVRDLGLDELRQEVERFLPAHVTGLGWNDGGDAFLGDVDFGATEDFFQYDSAGHFTGKIRIIEFIRVAKEFIRLHLEVRPAERVAVAGVEVLEGHLEGATDLRIHVVHLCGESVGRKPFDHGVGIEESAVDAFRLGSQHAVEADGVGGGCAHKREVFILPTNSRRDSGQFCEESLAGGTNLDGTHLQNETSERLGGQDFRIFRIQTSKPRPVWNVRSCDRAKHNFSPRNPVNPASKRWALHLGLSFDFRHIIIDPRAQGRTLRGVMVRLFCPSIVLCLSASLVLAEESKVQLGGGVELTLVRIEAGTFRQGSAPSEAGRNEDEVSRDVTLTKGFYLGKFPVTRGQFQRFAGETGFRTEAEKGASGGFGIENGKLVQRKEFTWKNPGFSQTENDPVVMVSWNDAKAFLGWLSRKNGTPFELPIEAQWEYACKAGTRDLPYPGGANADAVAWHKTNSEFRTHPVGQKALNPWGLGDMQGNVWEWCADWYGPWRAEAVTDPIQTNSNLSDKPRRVLRGGSFLKDPLGVRAAARYRNDPQSRNADNGFRVMAYSLEKPKPVERPATPPPAPPNLELENPNGASVPASQSLPSGISIHDVDFHSNSSNSGGGFVKVLFLIGGVVLVVRFLRKLLNQAPNQFTGSSDFSGNSGGAPKVRIGQDGFWLTSGSARSGTPLRCRYFDGQQYQEIDVVARTGEQFVYTGARPTSVSVLVLKSQISESQRMGTAAGMMAGGMEDRDRERRRREREEEERRRRNQSPSAY